MAFESDIDGEEASDGVGATSGPPHVPAASNNEEEERQRPGDEHGLGADDPRPTTGHERRADVDDDGQYNVRHYAQSLEQRSTTLPLLQPSWLHCRHEDTVDGDQSRDEERIR